MPTLSQNQKLARTAMLAAITMILALTPLGYIPVYLVLPFLPLTVTILVTPVALGGITVGFPAGTILSIIFGLSSFLRAPAEPLGAMLLAQSGLLSFLACLLPRLAVGLLSDFLGNLLKRQERLRRTWFYVLSGFIASLANTVLFLGFIWLAFDAALTGMTLAVIGGLIGFNGSVEAVTNAILVGILAFVLTRVKNNE